MNIKLLATAAKSWTINHAPELLFVGGVLAFGGSLICAAKAGSKTEGILEDHKEELKLTKEEVENGNADKKDVAKVYFHTGGKMVKTYAPTAGLATASLTCFGASYGILRKRYVAIAGAYVALDASYQAYRNRVIEDRGRDADIYYLTGVKPKQLTVVNENGEKEKHSMLPVQDNVSVIHPYIFKFSKYKANGERNLQWENNSSLNMSYVLGHERYFNDLLWARSVTNKNGEVVQRGSVFLNEIRDALGEDTTTQGSVCGWRFSNGEPGCNGYIDFRVMEGLEIDPEDGKEIPYILIDPNVDGLIYDLIGQKEKVPFLPNLEYINSNI